MTTNALMTTQTDGFALLAQAGGFSLPGERLKFRKDRYVIGKDGDELPLGTKLEAVDTREGWVKFVDSKLVEHVERTPGERFPEREELDDYDEQDWPTGLDGKPADPWSLNLYLYLIEPASGRDFTFITSSVGGHKAVR